MQQLYEDAVMWYVSAGGQRFVCPQFLIHRDADKWESNPDLVAVDFKVKTLYVIEVTTSSDASDVAKKIGGNARTIVGLLKENLVNDYVDFQFWKIKFRAFIRDDQREKFLKVLKGFSLDDLDIKPIDIERTLANWKWYDQAQGPVNSLD